MLTNEVDLFLDKYCKYSDWIFITHNSFTGVLLAEKEFGIAVDGVMVRDLCFSHYKKEFGFIPTLDYWYNKYQLKIGFDEFIKLIYTSSLGQELNFPSL